MTDTDKVDVRLREILRDNRAKFFALTLKIRTEKRELVPLVMNRAQRELDRLADQMRSETGMVRALVPKARQLGVSAYVAARGFHQAQTMPYSNHFVLTHREDATQEMLGKLGLFYDNMPPKLRHDSVTDNRKEFVFENGSTYRVGTAGGGGRHVGRSMSNNFVHWSEVALSANTADIAAGLLQTVPDQPGTEIWLESTGRGPGNYFHQECMKALAGLSDYRVFFLPWFFKEAYQRQCPRKFEFPKAWLEYQETYGLCDEQLYWAFKKNLSLITDEDRTSAAVVSQLAEEPSVLFRMEYPANVQDCFVVADESKFISALAIQRARNAKVETPSWVPRTLGVDVAGESDTGDYTTFVDRHGYRIGMAVMERHRGWRQQRIAHRIMELQREWNFARVFVDVTGGLGAGVVEFCEAMGATFVVGVNYGSSAPNERYANKRAWMWWQLKEILEGETPCQIPDDDVFAAHLLAPRNTYDAGFRQGAEPKSQIRKREGFSPDYLDAAAQNFAEDVVTAHGPFTEMLSKLTGPEFVPSGW